MKKLAVLQSSYLPWKGYFDMINDADVFVFYDDVKYTKNDWRNRNRVKMNELPVWLTIPIEKSAVNQLIYEVQIPSNDWQAKHWQTLQQAYGRQPYFDEYAGFFEDLYCGRTWRSLSELNQVLITQICCWLGITTELTDSRQFKRDGAKQDALLALLKQTGATHYVSGPSGRNYIDPEAFASAGIELEFKEYSYPPYDQGDGTFVDEVSIVDLLFRLGPACTEKIWGHRE